MAAKEKGPPSDLEGHGRHQITAYEEQKEAAQTKNE